MNRGAYDRLIQFRSKAAVTNDYGEEIEGASTVLAEEWARVRFGTGQEKREAAQEGAGQAATFEVMPTEALHAVPMTAHIWYDQSEWNITAKDDLARNNLRFSAVRAR
jgi:head-tail adaptor